MPHGERLKDAGVQGSPQPPGGRITGHQASLLLGIFGKASQQQAHHRDHGHSRPCSPAPLPHVRAAHNRGDLLVLQNDGSSKSPCLVGSHSFSCKNLYFFFQTVSGEIVKVIGHCQGKTSVCHPRSFPSVIPAVFHLSSPQFVAGIHLAVPALALTKVGEGTDKMDAR